jgi:uncharacterized protein (TIGR02246 family)
MKGLNQMALHVFVNRAFNAGKEAEKLTIEGRRDMATAEDRLEILDLIGRYSHGADGNDPTAYANVFTDDGVFQGRSGQPDEIIYRGRDQILAFAAGVIGGRGSRQTRHNQSTKIFLELTANKARTRTYLMTTTASEGTPPMVGLTSVYEDEIVRTDKGWRIKYRKIYPDVKGVLRQITDRATQGRS